MSDDKFKLVLESETVKLLFEKVSDAVGKVYEPTHIKRIAKAEATATKTTVIAELEIEDIKTRAEKRVELEELSRQKNIESIASKTALLLPASATPQNIENDWLVAFFDKCRIVSDDEMQDIWAKILSGEADSPGTFSRRTLQLLSILEKNDALLFSQLCNFVWGVGELNPLILNPTDEIYSKRGINFSALKHLDSLGLISFESMSGYIRQGFGKIAVVSHQGKNIILEFSKEKDNQLQTGTALFTSVGRELSKISATEEVEGFEEYVMSYWDKQGVRRFGVKVNSPNEREKAA